MAPRARLLALAGVAAVLAGVGLLGWSLGSGGPSADPVAEGPGSMASTTGSATSPSAGGSAGNSTGKAGSASDTPTTSDPGTPANSAGSPKQPQSDVPSSAGPTTSSSPQAASEVLPSPSTAPTGGNPYLPGLSSPSSAPGSLLTQVPEPATAKGTLAAGFPAELAPPDGSTIESSSVAVAGKRVQAALVADPKGGAKALLLHYRTVLGQRGFEEEPTQAPENAPAAAFRHGQETVTVTLQDGVCYLLANLRVAS